MSSQLIHELRETQQTIENIKCSIIRLRNDVLYGYVDKSKAYTLYDIFRKNLIDKSKHLEHLFEDYVKSSTVSIDLPKLEKEYGENMILYKTKLQIASKADHALKKKMVVEAVGIARHMQELHKNIYKLKHND